MGDPIFLTPGEAAEQLRVSVKFVEQLMRNGELPFVTLGPRTRRIPYEAIKARAAQEANLYQAEPVA